ncbi:MAG: hypothetical protein ABIP39_14270 [Polyangiaceae bacterium]
MGGAATDLRTNPEGAFHLGGRAELLFLRERESDMAVGTYVDLVTERLDTLELGAGSAWLIPIVPSFPLVASAGVFERRAPVFGWEPGLAANLFFGPRSYNFHSTYAMANGLFVQGRYGLGDGKQADVIFGVQIDLQILALPFLLAYEGLAH